MKFLEKFKVSKAMLAVILVGVMIPMIMVVAFADDGGASSVIDYSSIFSEDMFAPLLEGITSNVGVILPIGLGLFAVFLAPRLILIILDKFFGISFMAGSFWKWTGNDYVELWEWYK